jgi:hypothetical protein
MKERETPQAIYPNKMENQSLSRVMNLLQGVIAVVYLNVFD